MCTLYYITTFWQIVIKVRDRVTGVFRGVCLVLALISLYTVTALVKIIFYSKMIIFKSSLLTKQFTTKQSFKYKNIYFLYRYHLIDLKPAVD